MTEAKPMKEIVEVLSRPLSQTEISFRVQSINTGGYAIILAYKDARVDMNRLDEAFGIGGWQRKHEVINGNLFCSVGVLIDGHWIWKQDVGTESNQDSEKGQASDAFKRCCFNYKIGRHLYDFPLIKVQLFPNEFTVKDDGRGKKRAYQTWELGLRDWTWYTQYEKGTSNLQVLAARDTNKKVRFLHDPLKLYTKKEAQQ